MLISNPYECAMEFAVNTDRDIFITGKAGTGKTTFLHKFREETAKQVAIVAPTGVAAINAGGTTIHSFFQLPFTPFLKRFLPKICSDSMQRIPDRARKHCRHQLLLYQMLVPDFYELL
jgi:Cdc6-like AAA superfamily ATPase